MRNLLWPKKIHPACSRERIGPRPRVPSTSGLDHPDLQLHVRRAAGGQDDPVVQELLLLLCHNDEERKGAQTGRKLWTARRKGAQREMWTARRDLSPAAGGRSDHENARFRGGWCWREFSECYVHVIMGRAYVDRGKKQNQLTPCSGSCTELYASRKPLGCSGSCTELLHGIGSRASLL